MKAQTSNNEKDLNISFFCRLFSFFLIPDFHVRSGHKEIAKPSQKLFLRFRLLPCRFGQQALLIQSPSFFSCELLENIRKVWDRLFARKVACLTMWSKLKLIY